MSKKKRNLTNFSEFEITEEKSINNDTEKENETLNINNDTNQTQEKVLNNKVNDNKQVIILSNNNNEQKDLTVNSNTFSEYFDSKVKKQTIEDTHTRRTFLIDNNLLERLDKLSKKQKRGFGTYLVNYAIEKALIEIESK